jgi:predicted nucleotidyltransferase
VTQPDLSLPVGTQVVLLNDQGERASGAVAVVIASSAGHVELRFPDGATSSVGRRDVRILKHLSSDDRPAEPLDFAGGQRYIAFRCIVGSRAYGLDGPDSDTDRRGFYLPPADLHWSLGGVPEQLENEATQETYWEAQKFISLALKANPNVLECLYTPLVEHVTPIAAALLEQRAIFLSSRLYQTYNGYVLSQFKRLEQDLRTTGALKWKHAMHLIRLLLNGMDALRTGELHLRVVEHRDQLMAIRRGELSWEQINAWRLRLHREFDQAYAVTSLPQQPDAAAANAWLLSARRSMLEASERNFE